LAFFGNTLIFVIAGIVISHKIESLSFRNVLNVFIMYFSCTIIRGVVIFSVYTVMNKCGSNLERNDQFIAVWGGLRGAVGLALALLVYNEFQYTCSIIGQQVSERSASEPFERREYSR